MGTIIVLVVQAFDFSKPMKAVTHWAPSGHISSAPPQKRQPHKTRYFLQVKQWQKNYDPNSPNCLNKVTIVFAKREPSKIGKEQRDENRPVSFPAS
jgi:hypothetical protein